MDTRFSKKIIAVLGATGAQGGGLVRAILADPAGPFAVRAVTRDVNSAKAKALAAAGAQVVAANLDDEKSLTEAFRGCYGAFCVSFFFEHHNPEKELEQAKVMAQAAKTAGLEHVIWSSLEDVRTVLPVELGGDRIPVLMGKYRVPHFDNKGKANRIFLDNCKVTIMNTCFFFENFINYGMGPQKGPDGKLTVTLPIGGPDKLLPVIGAEDIGRCAYGILRAGPALLYTTVGVMAEALTGPQIAAAFAKELGVEIKFYAMPAADYRKLGFPGADDLGNMFEFKGMFNELFVNNRSKEFSRAMNPQLQTLADWLHANRQAFVPK